ncbi:serine hydrolase [uncultured Tateyamaria sp.]|uniref:serine hydrolase domain-containing protein n=1 Tax=Tateyamaria sp. 1078 TaxID=3417464 RepID=UPI002636446D|nr:serine hydrolase [uncultured Tateyamaria sp.]
MLRAALIWALTALPLAADGAHDSLQGAFDGWLAQNAITGSIGTAVRVDGTWQMSGTGARGELASVSKSITAVCALMLVEEGALDWSDTVADRLGRGPDVTLAQLVTHSSGLVRDGTQAAMRLWLDRPTGVAGHNGAAVLDIVTGRGDPSGTPGKYAYNNENYALAALMIEAASGQPFEAACWPRLGLSEGVGVSDRAAAFGPWGGIESDAAGYLDFLHRHFEPGSRLWEDPFAYPHVEIGGGAYYGLGMVFRPFGDGYNFWHFGALCFPGRLNVGSFAVIWEGRVSVLALYDACVDWDTMFALDAALAEVVFGDRP